MKGKDLHRSPDGLGMDSANRRSPSEAAAGKD